MTIDDELKAMFPLEGLLPKGQYPLGEPLVAALLEATRFR
jgi:hypothetical protein